MATLMATKRLKQDYIRLQRDPVPYISAAPLPSNILEWHYVVKGPEDTPYHGGYYHGKLVFPKDYPFKPPRIMMITPNGRFQTQSRLCLSISDFHPDTWNPAWSVSTILTGLLSFMVEKTATLGSIETTTEVKRALAVGSWDFNLRNKTFCQLFPDICTEIKEKQAEYEESQQAVKELTNNAANRVVVSRVKTPGNAHQGYCTGVAANLVLFLCVALFALLVRFLMTNSASSAYRQD